MRLEISRPTSGTDTRTGNILSALQLFKAACRKRWARRMTSEERKMWQEGRMRRINEQDMQDDTCSSAELVFPDFELDTL
jgi:hypothetical protein